MATTLTSNEEAQLLQTIEMFEVITQSQPHDYQSLEILKEAYAKLSRQQDVINTAKRIAEAYVQLGQLSSAILEYESILQQFPDDPDVQKALTDIENRAANFASPRVPETDFAEKVAAAPAMRAPGGNGKIAPADIDDGRKVMQKIFVDGKLVSPTDFNAFWQTPDIYDSPKQINEPFIQILSEKGIVPLEQSIKAICDKARVSFIPLDKYDIDIDLARTFPREVCHRWCIVPFDRMSKSVLVATANPFNVQAARELEAVTKNRLLWYISPPQELVKVVKKVFR